MTGDLSRTGGGLRRRTVLLAAAAAGLGAWWLRPVVAPLLVGRFEFEPLADPPGFRRIANGPGGATSGLPSPFIGLEAPGDTRPSEPPAPPPDDLCSALFGAAPPPGVVPIAAFSDYNCPYCRVLTDRLATLEERSAGGVRLTWHEWPRLGPASRIAARAALAADMQGAYAAFQRRLMRTSFVPGPRYIAEVAADIGVDPDRLLADMEGPEVAARLRITEAVARQFRFYGTPSLVVGRTVVIGTVPASVLAALVAQERRDGPPPACV